VDSVRTTSLTVREEVESKLRASAKARISRKEVSCREGRGGGGGGATGVFSRMTPHAKGRVDLRKLVNLLGSDPSRGEGLWRLLENGGKRTGRVKKKKPKSMGKCWALGASLSRGAETNFHTYTSKKAQISGAKREKLD